VNARDCVGGCLIGEWCLIKMQKSNIVPDPYLQLAVCTKERHLRTRVSSTRKYQEVQHGAALVPPYEANRNVIGAFGHMLACRLHGSEHFFEIYSLSTCHEIPL
jgi:hypothetical protein